MVNIMYISTEFADVLRFGCMYLLTLHYDSIVILITASFRRSNKRRCIIAILAASILALEIFFLGFAEYHIIASDYNNNNNSVKGHPGAISFFQGRDGDGGKRLGGQQQQRQRQQRQPQYVPDYTKFSTSHPPILYASSFGSLPSLPDTHRVPENVVLARNFTEHYRNWTNEKDFPTLFVYNPSIVSLFSSSSSSSSSAAISAAQQPQKQQKGSKLSENDALYLATFRVSSIHSCGFPTYAFWKYPIDYVGLAILDKDLNIVTIPKMPKTTTTTTTTTTATNVGNGTNSGDDSLDIIVDINHHLPRIFYNMRLKFQTDVRLFMLHDRVYMSSREYLIPICVQINGIDYGAGSNGGADDNIIGIGIGSLLRSSPAICNTTVSNVTAATEEEEEEVELPALYRNNHRLRLFVTGDAIRMRNVDGKNFQFFDISSSNAQSTSNNETKKPIKKTMMEYWPQGPRIIHDLGDDIAKLHDSEMEGNRRQRRRQKRVVDLKRRNELTSEVSPNPLSKVAMKLDSTLRFFVKRDRSSACCVRIAKKYYADLISSLPPSSSSSVVASELQNLDSIYVGISHSKSRNRMPSSQGDRYNYLSRLYAFSSVEPFGLVARSGSFCFGFPDGEDNNKSNDDDDAEKSPIDDDTDAYWWMKGWWSPLVTNDIADRKKRDAAAAAADDDYAGLNVVGNKYKELTKGKKLELHRTTYNCPNIHFVVSMIEKEGDESKLIVSYGVNDCVPRFLEISKRDFAVHLLFAGNG